MHPLNASKTTLLLGVAAALILASLACSPGGTTVVVTNTPEPTVVEPTVTPVEVEVTEEPTVEPAIDTGPSGPTGSGINLSNAESITELWYNPISETPLTASAASPVNHQLASFGFDKIVRLWDGDSGDLLAELPPHAEFGWGLAYSPDGSLLSSGGGYKVRVWDPNSGDLLSETTVNSFVFKTVWAPDGTAIAVVGQDSSRISVIDPNTGENITEIQSPNGLILWSVAFSPDGTLLATGNADGDVNVVNIDSTDTILNDTTTGRGSAVDLEFSPDGGLMASCNGSGGVYIWDTSNWQVVLSGEDVHSGGCMDGVFGAGSDVYFSVGADGILNAWDASSGDLLSFLSADRAIQAVSITGDGELLALALDDGGLSVVGLP